MTKITVNGFSLNVKSYADTFLISNKEVAEGFGVAEETIRYQKTQGSSEYLEGIHYTTVGNPNGGLGKTMWTKKGIVLLGFRLRETAQTIAFRDWATDFILEKNSDYRVLSSPAELVRQIWSDQRVQINMMKTLIENMPVTNLQQNELKRMKNGKVEELDYNNKEAHRKIWSLFKQHFHLPRYNELPQSKFEDGKNFILSLSFRDVFPGVVPYTPPTLSTVDYDDEIPF